VVNWGLIVSARIIIDEEKDWKVWAVDVKDSMDNEWILIPASFFQAPVFKPSIRAQDLGTSSLYFCVNKTCVWLYEIS
jgi:hypothetical protein